MQLGGIITVPYLDNNNNSRLNCDLYLPRELPRSTRLPRPELTEGNIVKLGD